MQENKRSMRLENMETKKLKIGQDVTLVSKEIRHSDYGKDYIESDQIGRTSFLHITKIGKKYLYGQYFYFEQDKRTQHDWEHDIIIADYLILNGIRTDLEKTYKDNRAIREDYNKIRTEAHRELERKYEELCRQDFDKWNQTFPTPPPVDLSKPPYARQEPISQNIETAHPEAI